MSRQWRFRLDDILDAIESIEEFTDGLESSEFGQNKLVLAATERCLEIIGEAVSRLPDELVEAHPRIPWAEIRGMRNILAHEYHRIKIPIIWKTVTEDLPHLKAALSGIIEENSG